MIRKRLKHDWVRYHNPRNKRVQVVACLHCGVARGKISDFIGCASVSDTDHLMKKMGWVVIPR